jgi:hypothetical protein
MALEHYEKWEPVKGITTPAGYALIKADQSGLSVTLLFSEVVGGLHTNLRLNCGRVPAYTVHEEYVHPWNTYVAEPLPKLSETWLGKEWPFPLLVVKPSLWLASFSEHQLIDYTELIHYRFVTLGQTVDVLCSGVPAAFWVKPQANDFEKV